jgi:hypothetical protein
VSIVVAPAVHAAATLLRLEAAYGASAAPKKGRRATSGNPKVSKNITHPELIYQNHNKNNLKNLKIYSF